MLEKGKKLYKEQNYEDAIEAFTMVLGHDQNHYLAREYLASCYFRLGKNKSYQKAKEHFEILAKYHTKDEKRVYAASMVATITSILGDYSEAIMIMKKLPKTTNNLINMCNMYWQKYKAEGGEWLLEEAKNILVKIDLDNILEVYHWRIHLTLGLIYQSLCENYLAKKHYAKALASTDDNLTKAKILNELGNFYREINEYDLAKATLNDATKYITEKTCITLGYNLKYKGMLEKQVGMLTEDKQIIINAKELLKVASNIFDENELLDELAEVNNILVELNNPDSEFYLMANLHAEASFTNVEERR